MSHWLIVFVTLAYVGVCVDQVLKGNLSAALIWGGYSLANVGLWFTMK